MLVLEILICLIKHFLKRYIMVTQSLEDQTLFGWNGCLIPSHSVIVINLNFKGVFQILPFFFLLKKNYYNQTFFICLGIETRDGNSAPPRLTRPSPLRPVRVFPAPQRWWGGDGVRFQTRTTGRGGDGFTLFRPTLPRLAPSPPRGIVLLNIQIIIFSFC